MDRNTIHASSHDIARDLRACHDQEMQAILQLEFWAAVEAEGEQDRLCMLARIHAVHPPGHDWPADDIPF